MTSPTLKQYHKKNSQVYIDRRLRAALNFASKEDGVSTREFATLALAEMLRATLEDVEGSEGFLRDIERVKADYERDFKCPIAECDVSAEV